MSMRLHLPLLALLLSFTLSAHAGFEEAVAAIKAKDVKLAVDEARKGADAGDPRACYLLGQFYREGIGVEADKHQAQAWTEKAAQGGVVRAINDLARGYLNGQGMPKDVFMAIQWARQSASSGNAEGQYLLAMATHSSELSYTDSNGKLDQVRLQQLAARPVSARSADVEFADNMFRAGAQNYPPAMLPLVARWSQDVGFGNRQRLEALIPRLPAALPPALMQYVDIARQLDKLGDTLVSPTLFVRTQGVGLSAAMVQACPDYDGKDKARLEAQAQKGFKVISAKVTQPLANAVFLPSSIPEYQHAQLISGQWDEEWTYEVCDKKVPVRFHFTADGMGSANPAIIGQTGR
ncbi:MAG: sel1 repeat family protein [Proteobacteria bacterium]|nr:sel1 repeat family protein [Pseudomonadota bacterium]HQR04354.1 tetratricopeptide repeat protein [Rhodocyclaceae bacterium]